MLQMHATIKILFAALVFSYLSSSVVYASNYTVRPFLIDTTLAPRESETHLVKLVNTEQHRKLTIYATVNEITVDTEGEIRDFVTPVMADQSNTVTSWIEVSRGRIELPAGEDREVPITFRINPKAQPGEYHAFIGFVDAPNRPRAESVARSGDADGVIIKISIADEREDSLHLSSFLIDRFVLGEDDKLITIDLENVGDLLSVPTGEIIFYDSRGVEISALLLAI